MIDYFASHLWQLWALVSFICLILELTNGDFFIMCFAIGGVCAAIASALGVGFYGGLLVFAICSVLSLWLVRPTALKYLHKNADERVSNADALMGRIGRVSETIEAEGYGRVAIDGDDWKAVSANGGRIEKGANVKVVGRDSIIITVEPA
ncbi:MAG: NfeD family protein [Prevotella sp.]|jgi:membrane protein implicated in regulation of membrane protease activity|nr:NfeD family protein [Prevotella sp.]